MNSPAAWPGLGSFDAGQAEAPAIAHYRSALADGGAALQTRFAAGEDIETLVRDRAVLVDALLRHAWARFPGAADNGLELVAVGGYGRGELHPGSDIDVTVLIPEPEPPQWQDGVSGFFTFLWDIGLEVGHSVRSIADCVSAAREDITIATALMESRPLAGSGRLYQALREAVAPPHVWPSPEFFEAKLGEQTARHHRYHDTAYNLEPNVKGSPGGLRDIQMIGWVAKRHFGVETSRELVDHGFLTDAEYQALREGRAFLWRVRFGLHVIAGRREDRLLFDHQIRLAEMLGYRDADHSLAVEQLMQRYYRTVMQLGRLNEMLLQLFREAILMDPKAPPAPINPRFQTRNGYLETVDPDVFTRHPAALLELFSLLQEHPALHGVSANTIRLVRAALPLIDAEFREDDAHRQQFLDILRAPRYVTHALRRMNSYGVLGAYLPAFGQIVGRMQYDLFHAYTVDAHTLFVVENLRRFARSAPDPAYPRCADIMGGLAKPEVAYLAALFHDIAKGRGGDHSELGASDAERFCLDHGLGHYDARLVAWLVRHHLLLSMTAQKKDIDDPDVLHEFAMTVGDEKHLDHLYVLTVADLCGTNPKLWNSWKASLFEELFLLTRRALRRGLENPIERVALVDETQQAGAVLLARAGVDADTMHAIWAGFGREYFLRHSPAEIAWHTRLLASRPDGAGTAPLIAIEPAADTGGTAIFIWAPQHQHTFARATTVLDQLGLSIQDARISRTADGDSLNTFRVLEDTGERITEPARMQAIEAALAAALGRADSMPLDVHRRAARQVRMFSIPTHIAFNTDARNERTIMELTAGDRPGILSRVGKAFLDHGVLIETAKISTIGERAEDVFYITGENDTQLSADVCKMLQAELTAALDEL